MFRPNWPSTDVQVVVMKESAAHCEAVLLSADSLITTICIPDEGQLGRNMS
jgi:hypothetical protein